MGSFICTDLGASSTRYCSDDGVIKWIPNNVCIVDENTVTKLVEWGADTLEERAKQSMDVTITKVSGAPSDYFPVRALIGDIGKRYSSNNIRPNGMQNKHKQQINYISAMASLAVNRLSHGVMEDDIDMYIALPPIEAKPAMEYVQEQLVGDFEIKFNMLDMTVKVHIKSVTCLEESYMAITSFFFNIEGTLNENHARFAKGNLLSLDIGASTTDLAAVQDRKFLERTGKTYKIGGNVVRDIVADYIQQEFGYEIDEATVEQAVAEGRVQSGNTYVDCSKYVVLAKETFATQIVNNMHTYFRTINIPLQSFKGIVVSGGGSMPSQYVDDSDPKNLKIVKTSEPMSTFIADKLKGICDTIEVVHIEDSPRFSNIRGMFVRATFDKVKKEKERAAGQTA